MQAAQKGITIHTLAVGAEADDDLMKAIAFMGGGIYIDVPGGTSRIADGGGIARGVRTDRVEGAAGKAGLRSRGVRPLEASAVGGDGGAAFGHN